jgi:hypothetical protein
MINLRALAVSLLAGAAAIPAAYAQNATLGTMPSAANVASMTQADLCPIVKGGVGGVPTGFVPCGQAAALDNYSYQVPTTGFSITPANNVSLLFLNPAGTLATGTLTMKAVPSPGENFCIYDTQTQTAITVAGNTGQSIGGTAVTALVANTKYCWQYISQTATWYRTL